MGEPLTFDPFDPVQTHAFDRIAQRLHREAPILQLPGGFVLLSRYRHMRQLFTQPTIFANAGGFRPTGLHVPLEDRTLGELDPPEHPPIRRVAMLAVAEWATSSLLPEFVRRESAGLLDAMVARGGGDVVADFALPLTNRVIATILGVPLERADWLAGQAETILSSDLPVTNRTGRGCGYAEAFPEFTAFIDGLIEERGKPNEIIARIIDAAAGATVMPPATMVRMVLTQLLLGGAATTRDFLGNMIHRLVIEPDLHRALRDDASRVPAAVEEGLRLMPPVLFVIRTCNETTEIDGVPIEAGQRVIAAVSMANRDAEAYPDPDAFRIDRVDPLPHFSFGMGSHFCIGNAVARVEITHALATFIKHVTPGQLALAEGFALEWMPTPFLFGPRAVAVTVRTY